MKVIVLRGFYYRNEGGTLCRAEKDPKKAIEIPDGIGSLVCASNKAERVERRTKGERAVGAAGESPEGGA